MITNRILHPSSYKDCDAQIYFIDNQILREIKPSYFKNYNLLMNSGLYLELTEKKLLIKHVEEKSSEYNSSFFIKPEEVFISYPWEWSFSQLKDAALLTLQILKISLNYGMILKDANCYNVQFHNGKPIFIDTTSFEKYEEGMLWLAYGQFCSNFIAPLALMAYTDLNLSKLFLSYIDGLDLSLVAKLLPVRCRFNINLFLHIYQHSFYQKRYEGNNKKILLKYSKFHLLSLIDSLERCINSICSYFSPTSKRKQRTPWDDYYNIINYSDKSFKQKIDIIEVFKNKISPQKVLDVGANNGYFSRLFSESSQILSIDFDINAVEQNYKKVKMNNEQNILPLVVDIVNPSPAIGVNNNERFSFLDRSKDNDLVLALALIHHLVICKNLHFYQLSTLFSKLGRYLL